MSAKPEAPASAIQDIARERDLAAYRYPIQETVDAIRAGQRLVLAGAFGSWLGLVLADLQERIQRPLVIVTPRADDARTLHEAFSSLSGRGDHAHLLPAPDVSPWGDVTPDRNVVAERMLAIHALESLGPDGVFIASAVAWARRVVPREVQAASSRTLNLLDEVNHDELRALLLGAGYSPVALVEDPGTFSMRGDRVDIFSTAYDRPARIEFYGDMVETIRWFDPATQRGAESIEAFTIVPVREELITDRTLATARRRLSELSSELQAPSSRFQAVLRDLGERTRFFGIEGYLPALVDGLEPLSARLPEDALVVVVEPDRVEAELNTWLNARRVEYEREIATGKLCFRVEEFFVTEDEIAASWEQRPGSIVAGRAPVLASPLPEFRYPALDNADVVRLRKARPGDEGTVKALLEHMSHWRELYGRIVILTASRGSADRLERLFRDHDAPTRLLTHAPDLRATAVPPATAYEIAVGDLRTGFRSPARGLAVVTDHELLGRGGRKPSREVAAESTSIANFRELQPNDLIVHVDHGVARYLGLERMDVGGYQADFLVLQYADNDKLYLPVYRLARVQKYTGSATFTRLDKLGGQGWEKTKERVKRQLADMAAELLQVQAERQARRGYAFSAPDVTFHDFEAAFPYEETTGQAQAIEEVLADMMSERPMDRLLCGDVGFGKTEVAIRAAFKAVVDGKQVAVLVPTTVLAEQHLKSFRERLSGTAARVECVSRFRTPGEVREIMEATRLGRVDVLIGTHRILSKDIEFKDLGLLVIDEEQRFGVQHKERLKALRSTVDVLTMSATPIPRTLEMSLLGIRDLSMITTPPAGRLAVRTHLAKFTESVVREAILTEIQRGGQVFFVHNRVETIYNVADRIAQMVPEAKVLVAHAQMRDTELEDVMLRFLNREGQVLVSTTIVESGLDVASANTIFINEAQNFGLSQLHQLRGRVGRGSERAFCYLLVADPRHMTPDARRRLEVIQEHTELGSGLQIAHQDLDLRGAGNVLGRDQSGHIESIGFELFTELLEEAIAELQGSTVDDHWEPEVKVPVPAYIPEEYVEDVSQRLAFYKRFSLAESDAVLFDLHGEIEERYGKAPAPVTGLRDVVSLKLAMKRVRANRIEVGPRAVIVELQPQTPVVPDQLIALMERQRGKWEFRPGMVVVRHLKGAEGADMLAAAMMMSRELLSCLPD